MVKRRREVSEKDVREAREAIEMARERDEEDDDDEPEGAKAQSGNGSRTRSLHQAGHGPITLFDVQAAQTLALIAARIEEVVELNGIVPADR